jgi:hypothetical protein
VPRQNSTGGRARLGRITKIGDQYLRNLLIVWITMQGRPERADRRSQSPICGGCVLSSRPQSRVVILVREGQAEFTSMRVDAALAGGRDLPFTHQSRHPWGGYVQKLANDRSIEQERFIAALYGMFGATLKGRLLGGSRSRGNSRS